MSERKSSSRKRSIGALLCVVPVAGLGACSDYLKHRDTITFAAGDSKAWNSVIHTADPWPPYVRNTRIQGDGRRVEKVIGRYSTGEDASKSVQTPPGGEQTIPGEGTARNGNRSPD